MEILPRNGGTGAQESNMHGPGRTLEVSLHQSCSKVEMLCYDSGTRGRYFRVPDLVRLVGPENLNLVDFYVL